MAISTETIRKITIQASTAGVSEATSAINALGAAQTNLAAKSDATATVTDLASRRQLSAAQAYQRQTLSVVDGARAQDQLAKAIKTADAALAQGIITTTDHTKRIDLLTQKYGEVGKGAAGFGSALGSLQSVLGTLGIAFGVGQIVRFGEELFKSTAGLENQAKVLGISTDALQAFHAAAVLSGAGADVGDAAIMRFTRNLGVANEQAGPVRKAFVDLFGDATKAQAALAGGAEIALPKVAAALLNIKDKSEQARLEFVLLGRGGQELNVMLEQLAGPDVVQHMADLGLVIDQNLVKRAHEADVAWETFFLKFKVGLVDAFGSAKNAFNNPSAPGYSLIMGPPDASKMPFAGADSLGIMGKASGAAAAANPWADPEAAKAAKKSADDLRDEITQAFKDMTEFTNERLAAEIKYQDMIAKTQAIHSVDFQKELDNVEKLSEKKAEVAAKDIKVLEDLSQQQFYGMTKIQYENAQKVADEEIRQQQRAADESTRFWDRMFDNMFQSGTFNFKKLLAEFATEAIARPIIVPIIMSAAGSVGLGGLGTAGGIGGLGSLTGLLGTAPSIANGNIGTGILGAEIGGASVSGILGIAGLAGIAASLVGSLFKSKPSNFTAYSNFGADYSQVGGIAGDKPNATTTGLATQAGAAIASAAKALEDAGVTLQGGVQRLEIGSRDQSSLVLAGGQKVTVGAVGDVQAAVTGTINYLLGGATSSNPAVQKVLDYYKGSGGLNAGNANAIVASIDAVGNFDPANQAAIDQLTNPVLAAWNTLMKTEQASLDQARQFGLDTTLLERRNQLEQAAFVANLNAEQRTALEGLVDVATELALKVADAKAAALTLVGDLLTTTTGLAGQYRTAGAGIAQAQVVNTAAGALDPVAQYRAASGAFQGASGLAAGGDLTALQSLPKLAQDFANASLAASVNQRAYNRDLASIAASLGSAGGVADQQASALDVQAGILAAVQANLSQAQIDTVLLQQQLSALGQVGNLVGAGNGAVVTQLQLLIQLQAQLAAAPAAIVAATVAASAAAVVPKVPLTGTQLAEQLGPITGLWQGHNTPLMDIQQALIRGLPISDASWAQANLPPGGNLHYYASGGDFGGGWASVGEQGPELVRMGPSRIYSNAQSKSLVDNSGVISAVDNLRAEVAQLRQASIQTAASTSALERFFRTISPDGNSINTKAA